MNQFKTFPGVAQSVWRHRKSLQKSGDRLRLIASLVNSPNDLELRYYPQLYASVLEFQPDLILEIGRGFGNSTSIFVEASRKLPGMRVVSVCLNSSFQRVTAPKLREHFGGKWFDPLEARVGNIVHQDIKGILKDSKRVLVYWDAHGLKPAEFILSSVFPLLADRQHLIFIDDVIDREFRPQMHPYRGDSLWKPTLGEHAKFPYLFSKRYCSAFDEILVIEDFTVRNGLEIHSIERQMRDYFSNSLRRMIAKQTFGKDLFSTYSKIHYFTMNERKGNKPLSFPAPSIESTAGCSVANESFAAGAYSRQEPRILAHRKNTMELIQHMGMTAQLHPYQWDQLMAVCWEFEPDLIIDLNGGNLSVLGALLEGSHFVDTQRADVITITEKLEAFKHFKSKTSAVRSGEWTGNWDVIPSSQAEPLLSERLQRYKRVLVHYNSRNEKDSDVLLRWLLPAISGRENLIVCLGISDTRYLGVHHLEYQGAQKNGFVLGHLQSDNPNVVALFDFLSRNQLDFHSAKKSFSEFFSVSGENLMDAHFFWFTLPLKLAGQYFFPPSSQGTLETVI